MAGVAPGCWWANTLTATEGLPQSMQGLPCTQVPWVLHSLMNGVGVPSLAPRC